MAVVTRLRRLARRTGRVARAALAWWPEALLLAVAYPSLYADARHGSVPSIVALVACTAMLAAAVLVRYAGPTLRRLLAAAHARYPR